MNNEIIDLVGWLSGNRKELLEVLYAGMEVPQDSPILTCPVEELYEVVATEYQRKLFNGRWVLRFPEEEKLAIEQGVVTDISTYCPKNPSILDVGCGDNRFKKYFEQSDFIGIDPFNERADLMMSLEEFFDSTDQKFDAIIAHGSLNFGNRERIIRNFHQCSQLLKPNGIMSLRFNLGHVPPCYAYLDVYNEWVNIFEVFNVICKNFNVISRYKHNYRVSFCATLRKQKMYNLQKLFESLADKEKTVEALEKNLGYLMDNRDHLLSLEDGEFLCGLSDKYKAIFFEKIWKGNLTEEQRLQKNGRIQEIVTSTWPGKKLDILDIGCGFNHLRKYFPDCHFVGIDPNNENADLRISLEEFLLTNDWQWDVIICQGNLHFGSKAEVRVNLEKVINLLKPGGFKNGGLLFVRFNVNRVPTLYPYLDIVEGWTDYLEVVELFSEYMTILSDITIDNGHRIEFYGIRR